MWEAIATFIKSFNEKYLIPFVISLVTALFVLIFLPADFWMITKIGIFNFGVGVAGITFLVVLLVYFVYTKIVKKLNEASNERYRKEIEQIQFEKDVRTVWARIDRFSPDERKIIRDMVASKNQPILTNYYTFFSSGSLYESEIMVSSTTVDDKGQYSHVFKLKEEYYQLLKYSMENFNKISDFD